MKRKPMNDMDAYGLWEKEKEEREEREEREKRKERRNKK